RCPTRTFGGCPRTWSRCMRGLSVSATASIPRHSAETIPRSAGTPTRLGQKSKTGRRSSAARATQQGGVLLDQADVGSPLLKLHGIEIVERGMTAGPIVKSLRRASSRNRLWRVDLDMVERKTITGDAARNCSLLGKWLR